MLSVRKPIAKTNQISFDVPASLQSPPRERPRPRIGARRLASLVEKPRDPPSQVHFVFSHSVPAAESEDDVGKASPARKAWPWSGVLSSKPLWGDHPNDRPVAMGAFDKAYSNMQPQVKKLLRDDNMTAQHAFKDRCQHALATGLRNLLAESKSRQDKLANAKIGTGKGSRIQKADDEMERKISERLARIREKERKKEEQERSVAMPGDLTGWGGTASAEPTDVPTPEGVVASVSSSSLGSGPKKRRGSGDVSSENSWDCRLFRSLGESQGTSRSAVSKQKSEYMADTLEDLLDESNSRANSAAASSNIGTGTSSRFVKADQDYEKKIQARINRLRDKDQMLKRSEGACEPSEVAPKSTPLEFHFAARDDTNESGTPDANVHSTAETSDVQHHSANVFDGGAGCRLPHLQTPDSLDEPLKTVRDARGMVTEKDGLIYEGIFADSSLDTSVQISSPNTGTWADKHGLVIQRNSREVHKRRAGGSPGHGPHAQLSFERSISNDGSGDRFRMGLFMPKAIAKYEGNNVTNEDGNVIVHSGDSEIDQPRGVSHEPCSNISNESDGIPRHRSCPKALTPRVPTPESKVREIRREQHSESCSFAHTNRSMRWAQKLQLGASILQRTIRCHFARVQHRLLSDVNASDSKSRQRQVQSLTVIGVIGKLKNKVEIFRSTQSDTAKDGVSVESICNSIPSIRALFLQANMKDFLNAVDVDGEIFFKIVEQLAPDVVFHFQEALSRADAYATLSAVENSSNFELWEPADTAQAPLSATNEQYIKVFSELRLIKALKQEDAPKLARALGLFLDKIKKIVRVPDEKQKMPPMEMAAKWLRANHYNVARALKRYETLLEFSRSWASDCVDLWRPSADDIVELENRGLTILRAADGSVLEDKNGGAVALVHAHKVFVKGKHSVANTQALFALFWHHLTTDFGPAIFNGITGQTVVDFFFKKIFVDNTCSGAQKAHL